MPDGPWAPSDPLGEALHLLRMNGVFYGRSELAAPWGMDIPAFPHHAWFHVTSGSSAWLRVDGAPDTRMRPGSFVLVPHGTGHSVLSDPDVATRSVFDFERELISECYEVLRHDGGGAPTMLVCGAVRFDHPVARRLVEMLPSLIHVEPLEASQPDWIHSTLTLLASEARQLRPGGEEVITRLADILVIQAIRSWMSSSPAAHTGWLGALQDPQIGHALALIHREPARPWTVASLARELAMSRSAFAARFTALVGEPVMRYVTRWRMQVAHDALSHDGATAAELAHRLGYQSEAAFARAFKRNMGTPPGAVKRHAMSR